MSASASQTYDKKWKGCKLCPLHQKAKNHVLYRSVGSFPVDFLFVGEAPGHVEDRIGRPFIGPSGDILNCTLHRLGLKSYCITNIVCCIPLHDGFVKGRPAIRPPHPEEAEKCRPHLFELIEIAQPKLVISLGEVAKKHLVHVLSQGNIPSFHLRHPAYILRRGGLDSAEHKLMIKTLQDICAGFNLKHTPYFTATTYSKEVVRK